MTSDDRNEAAKARDVSRRGFLRGASEVAAGGVIAQSFLSACATSAEASAKSNAKADEGPAVFRGEIEIELDVNGAKQKVRCEPRTTLLNALRNHCAPPLTGTKLVCDRGNCGACTVIVDGAPRYACLQLALDCRSTKIRTIEGLASSGAMSPLQTAFAERDALMCGFCTPGFVMAIQAKLDAKPDASLDEIKDACAGNLCRCGTYPHIFEAALQAARATRKG